MQSKVTTATLMKKKEKREKIAALTAYDYTFARLVDRAGMDMVLVGDSLAMVVQGKADTLGVTMEEMLYHTRMVARGCECAMVVGDMPFLSYHGSVNDAVINAGRFLKEAGASAVKLEGGADVTPVIEAVAKAGIPVQAHIGLTPQSVHQMGGFRVQRDEERLLSDARKVQDAGAFSVVLEGMPASIARKITDAVEIPTIGIGAGEGCDGQILVINDMLAVSDNRPPKFVKQYADINSVVKQALESYISEVREGRFPSEEYQYK